MFFFSRKSIVKISGFLFVLVILLFSSCSRTDKEEKAAIIPVPFSERPYGQAFTINNETRIVVSGGAEGMMQNAVYLQQLIAKFTGAQSQIQKQEESKSLQNILLLSRVAEQERLGAEGYRLSVDKNKAVLTANDDAGIFYGIQTLYQLFDLQRLKNSAESPLVVPVVRLWDEPRFPYRGMHLDVARHFFGVEHIKQYIDMLAYYKFNTFHWHLTDDQGWRIEIKKYPKLTEVGAWRTEADGSKYGGFYTQQEIKDIVDYAQKLQITIIPEIEMPGHSRAALAAYPELSCTGIKQEVPASWGVFDDIYCAGNEQTFAFLEDVLDEVIDLFPGSYIHIGGDEAPKHRWENCTKCQARMRKEGLQSEEELQSYFIKRMAAYLHSKGKKIIGWDEILEGGLAKDATVMSWRGTEGGIAAARLGNEVVMTPTSHCYFDYYQADKAYEPKAIGGYLTLEKVYNYEPVPDELFTEQKELIKGAQGNVWTEYMPDFKQVEYMVLPRMLALSEVLWSKEDNKDWLSFQKRLQAHFEIFLKKGYAFSKGTYRLRFNPSFDSIQNKTLLTISSEQYQPAIYYTLDGSMPDTTTNLYQKPFELSETDTLVRAGFFEKGKQMRAISEYRAKR